MGLTNDEVAGQLRYISLLTNQDNRRPQRRPFGMQNFTIKEVERLSGIKAHTLRIWEQRYGVLHPMRKTGNHRIYSNDDLKKLLRVVFLYQQGYKISEIARLEPAEMEQLIQPDQGQRLFKEASLLQLTEAVMDFDDVRMVNGIHQLVAKMGFETTMRDVLFPLLNRIGIFWLTDKLIPGQEHFASNIISRKLVEAIDKLPDNLLQQKGLLMLFTPPGEYHEIGLLFLQYLLKRNGMATIYLGVGASMEILQTYSERHRPSHLVVYLTSNLQDESPDGYIKLLCSHFPQVKVVACGPGTKAIEQVPEGCLVLKTEESLLLFSRNVFGFVAHHS